MISIIVHNLCGEKEKERQKEERAVRLSLHMYIVLAMIFCSDMQILSLNNKYCTNILQILIELKKKKINVMTKKKRKKIYLIP